MKLLFPNGEHAPVALAEGTVVVGSDEDCALRLELPGIAERHCELTIGDGQARVRPLTDAAATVLNGKQVVGEADIKPGDLLLFGKIGCRVIAAGPARRPPPASQVADDDMGHTRVRMAMPKYVLRGVSGPTFGKVFAMAGSLTVGRSSDADISIAAKEISRHHARLQTSAAGVTVEDLGSANGTFVNDRRVQAATPLEPGDEVRFDTVRFLLVSTAQEAQPASPAPPKAAATAWTPADRILWILAGVVVLAGIALTALRLLGRI